MGTQYFAASSIYQLLKTERAQLSALPAQAYEPVAGGAAVLPVWLSAGPYGIHPASIGLLSLQSSVPWAEIKLGMQIRWFQFFTRKRAHRLYPAKYPDRHCQLCTPPQPQEETPGHYFGGCTPPLMRDMKCRRHGLTIMHLVRPIRAGSKGRCALYHDSELGDRTARVLPAAIPRLPGQTLPHVVFLPNVEPVRLATHALSPLTPAERTIVIMEVAHCGDSAMADKVSTKIGDHESWMDDLVAAGWTVHFFPIVVSHSGLVTNTAAAALEHCGVAASGATAAVRRIARSTLTYNTKFRNARRKLYSMLDEHPHDPG